MFTVRDTLTSTLSALRVQRRTANVLTATKSHVGGFTKRVLDRTIPDASKGMEMLEDRVRTAKIRMLDSQALLQY